MRVAIAVVALGGWYPRGVSRLIEQFHAKSDGFEICAHVNTLPSGAPANVIENGWDYTGYCAKPFALRDLQQRGVDIGILMDASFYPIRHILPLVDHIARTGYYLCKNGFPIGQWASDRALGRMLMSRDEAMGIDEASSYCVGLDFRTADAAELLDVWCGYAADRLTFPGPHTNVNAATIHGGGRNVGWCSDDPRCSGHRHDQTALSVIAYRLGMRELIERPKFTAYLAGYGGQVSEETVLVNQGGL